MDTKRTLILFLILSLAVVGCSGIGDNVEGMLESPTPVMTNIVPIVESPKLTILPTMPPTLPPSAPIISVTPTSGGSACEAEKWEFIPIGLYEYPDRDGWKILVIPFATYNGSSYWGNIATYPSLAQKESSIKTEGGFVYPIYLTMNNILKLPAEPTDSPYSGAYEVPSQINNSPVLPPGFYYRGDHFVGGVGPTLTGSPTKWQQLVFRVPVTQEHFQVRLPSVKVICFKDGGREVGDIPVTFWDLDNDIRLINFPTDRPNSEFLDIVGIQITKGQSVFEINEVLRADLWPNTPGNEELDLFFSLHNTNQGYDIEDGIYAYVIGEDGIRRSSGCGTLRGCEGIEGIGESMKIRVGPGQVKEGNLAFVVDPNLRNLKLVWVDIDLFLVFNLPDEN